MSALVVRPVQETRSDHAEFVQFPRMLFRSSPAWLPEPESAETALLDREKNPFFEHADVRFFLAERDGETVGRIAAFVDQTGPDDVASFGFLDLLDDPQVMDALFDEVSRFAASRGRARIRGPVDFWPVLSAGVLIEGFDQPNYVGVRHALPYYRKLVEGTGATPWVDLAAWQYGRTPVPPPALGIAAAVWSNPSLETVEFDPDSDEHWDVVAQLYNASYVDDAWYLPLSARELRFIAKDRVDPGLSRLVFMDGEPAATAIAWANTAQASLRIGSMLPAEPIQRIWRTANRAPSWRQWLFAVEPRFRGRTIGGLQTALYVKVRRTANDAGYERGEASFTSTVAERLRNGLSILGAEHYKTYRVFEKGTPQVQSA